MPYRKILVVDDSSAQRKKLELHLAKWNYSVIKASDGEEGLAVFLSEQPPLLITDLNMPGMDGFGLIRAVREREIGRTYIIVISALEDRRHALAALSSGADDYLTKPYYPDELRVRLAGAERHIQLQNQYLLIFAMAKLVDARSPETGEHLNRIKLFCDLLAEDLVKKGRASATPQWREQLAMLSPLHDIGKVAIPDAVLNKPGRLAPEEFEIVKRHPRIGADLISDIYRKTNYPPFGMAVEIIAGHHEKYDGSGYPDGLAGENIPLSARVVALADVYDAISSKRVYKPAFPREECRRIVLEGSGLHFDPCLVDIFDRVEPAFWEVTERLRDRAAI